MKRVLAIFLFCLTAASLHAQVTDATVCDVLKDPAAFNGKILRLSGTVVTGFEVFILKGENCGQKLNAIWLAYPERSFEEAGPLIALRLQAAKNFAGTTARANRTPVKLEKDKSLKQFDSLLSKPYSSPSLCLGCFKNAVTATLTGRLDGVADAAIQRNSDGKIIAIPGFGNFNAYSARLVIQSVTNVVAVPNDFSAAAAIPPPDPSSISNMSFTDTMASMHEVDSAFPAGSAPAAMVRKAAAVFANPDDPGVPIDFATTNEENARLEAASNHNSTDGVIYNCTFNSERMKGPALGFAVMYLGAHISVLRNLHANPNIGPYDVDAYSWKVTLYYTMARRQHALILPGGYIFWEQDWSAADRNKLPGAALGKYLSQQLAVSR